MAFTIIDIYIHTRGNPCLQHYRYKKRDINNLQWISLEAFDMKVNKRVRTV
ncbi:hypothetical protein LguiB_020369 [Lonicera macranthoides]